jgi:hypothetical protein
MSSLSRARQACYGTIRSERVRAPAWTAKALIRFMTAPAANPTLKSKGVERIS